MVGPGDGSPFAPGTRVGPYRVEAFLGRGSSGHVYRARDDRLERTVAVKVLPGWLVEDDRARARFLAEARLAASLDHPHVLPVYDAGEDDGIPWIAMRLATGPDLREVIRRHGALPPARVVHLLDGIAGALDAAHAIGLLHRDVKPGNIVLAGQGRDEHAYLADFGLATLAHDRSLTRTGELLGTIDYVSPEQARGDPLDARSDVYALAAVAYEALTGRPPFGHLTALASLGARLREPPPAPTTIRPDLPARVDGALLRGLAPDPRERPPGAGPFLADLRAAIDGPQLRGFLFADLRGYTAFTTREGDERAAALLERYRTVVRFALARTGGAEIRTEGDSFYAVFPSASSALRAGLAIAAGAGSATAEDPALPIEVGVGVHAGEPAAAPEGPVGAAVNVAARICALAGPGDVLASTLARELAAGATDLAFEPRGRRVAKGLPEPVETWAVQTAGGTGPSAAPDATVATAPVSAARARRRATWAAALAIGAAAVAVVALAVGLTVGPGRVTPSTPAESAPGPAGSAAGGSTGAATATGAATPSVDAPALGATPTPGAFPNEAERALLATLPVELAATCERGATADDARLAGFVGKVPTAYAGSPPRPVGYMDILPPAPLAGVTCRVAGGGPRVYVQRQPLTGRSVDSVAVADEYLGYLAGRWEAAEGDCAGQPAARGYWTSSAGSSGGLACFRSHPHDGRPWLYFTYGGGRYLAFATRNDADYDALLEWWESLRPFLP